jgi:multiple sugar transport system ATP-binding protein
MATIRLEDVHKSYANGFEAVKGIDLEVAEGEFVVLVGPSGCGKTTLLRMVAGLEEITSGTLRIGGVIVNDIAPKDRDIAMVFQNYALYPHMTVAGNIGFALKQRKVPKEDLRRRVEDAARLMGLSELLDQKPGQLSGGQRQRVAMGRALVREPVAFLMDEPLSNLDARLRVQMRAEIRRLQRRLGVATLYVTHDQTEAMTMGDRVAVLRSGTVRQFDTPQVLYDRPADVFVGGFIGSPAMNLYVVELGPEACSLVLGSQTVALPESLVQRRPGLRRYVSRNVVVGMRPEHLRVGDSHCELNFVAEVDLVEPLGSEQLVHFGIDAARVSGDGTQMDESPISSPGAGVAKVDSSTELTAGGRVTFTLPGERIHFFDVESQLAIWD